MANEKNLKPFTSDQDREEAAKNGKKGGKASGEARRKKANFRKTLNTLLQHKIDVDGISPILEQMGIENTIENAINLALISQALSGNVQAYKEIRSTLGLSDKTELDEKEQKQRIKEREGGGSDTQGLKSFLSATKTKEEEVKELFSDENPEKE